MSCRRIISLRSPRGAALKELGISAAVLLAGFAAFLALLASMESRFIYFPMKAHDASPGDFGLEAEDVSLRAEDGTRLHGWWLKGKGRRAALFLHGNAGNVSHRLERATLLVERLGLDVLLLDYRGYGRSEGKPSEKGLSQDARAGWEEIARRGFPPEQILLFGESLGSAVATSLALERACGAVILETPFLSIPAMARRYYPFVPRALIRSRFDIEARIARLATPKLIVAAERDEIVPPDHAQRLFAVAREPKELYVIPGAGHNDTYLAGGEEYLERLSRFLSTAMPATD